MVQGKFAPKVLASTQGDIGRCQQVHEDGLCGELGAVPYHPHSSGTEHQKGEARRHLANHGSGHAANPDLAVRCQAAGAYVGGLEDLDYYIGNQVDPSL